MTRRPSRHALAVTAALACLATAAGTLTATGAAAHDRPGHGPGHDRTHRLEASRVDRVPTPDPAWTDCSAAFGAGAECGSVTLPLDYDRPRGATTDVALLRVRATDPAQRVGTLFVNPGGPGGSGVELAALADALFSPELRARFDVVGFDPRGTNFSTHVQCFRSAEEQAQALAGLQPVAPEGPQETAAQVRASTALARACSTTGTPESASVSTAQVARDLDVLRRAVGDERLNYLGFSYGSYLGAVYASMFPDRFRALAVDGVVDPDAFRGTLRTAHVPTFVRTGSPQASGAARDELLERCAEAGPSRCLLAGLGDPATVYRSVVDTSRTTPVPVTDPWSGAELPVGYDEVVSVVQSVLYVPNAPAVVDVFVWAVHHLQQPPTEENAAVRAQARAVLDQLVAQLFGPLPDEETERAKAETFGRAWPPYPSGLEAATAVLCTDGLHPLRVRDVAGAAERTEREVPDFGAVWAWPSAPCALTAWTARDEDAWAGGFSPRTAAPVLVVGNTWDPATPYSGAVALSRKLPNSRLLSSDSWGHGAYGTSACATGAIDRYLVAGELPAPGTWCAGDDQPFPEPAGDAARSFATGPAVPEVAPRPATPPLPTVPEVLTD
ncbi:alpha/beta hydrolase [Cellulomonas telluris]|uniref:alpha/beta hydrolase n=1 Tax=Cellulomonas telluris TaxID=2306636 RepID=UPI0010A7E0BA|nr:alpha/beta hydrolase [Cellulomonas telluris]